MEGIIGLLVIGTISAAEAVGKILHMALREGVRTIDGLHKFIQKTFASKNDERVIDPKTGKQVRDKDGNPVFRDKSGQIYTRGTDPETGMIVKKYPRQRVSEGNREVPTRDPRETDFQGRVLPKHPDVEEEPYDLPPEFGPGQKPSRRY